MFNPKKAMKIRTEPLSELDYKKIKDVFESALFMLDLLMFCNILSVILLRLKTYTTLGSVEHIQTVYPILKFGVILDAFVLILGGLRPTLDYLIGKKRVGVGTILLKYRLKNQRTIIVWFDRLRFVPISEEQNKILKRKDTLYLELGYTTSSLLYKIEKMQD